MASFKNIDMRKFTVSQLKDIAHRNGFLNYLKLNKSDLIDLILNGIPDRPRIWEKLIIDGKGIGIDKIFTAYDDIEKYDITVEEKGLGYAINGVNLDGMFNSVYVPDKVEQVNTFDYGDESDYDSDYEPVPIVEKRTVRGYWFVPRKDYFACKNFLQTIRDERK